MNKLSTKILSFISAIILTANTIPAASGITQFVMPKKDSVLTVDDTDSGYIRGIWGTVTAGELAKEFEGTVEIRRGGTPVPADSAVASDDTVSAGAESFPVIIYGDANRDGRINLADVSLILKRAAKWEAEPCIAAADVSMNGRCDLSDASMILKWIAGWDVTLADAVFPPTDVSLSGGFYIVIPEDCDSFERMAAEYLAAVIDTVYGENRGNNRIIGDSDSAEREILIGGTSRSRTAEVTSELEPFGWAYSVPTDSTVVIAGDDSIATYEAVQAFAWDLFGYVNRYNVVKNYSVRDGDSYVDVTASDTVRTGTERIFEYTPVSDGLTLGGRGIEEYDIVTTYPDDEATQVLRRAILRETGDAPDVVKSGDEDASPAIRLGVGKDDGTSYGGTGGNVFAIGCDGDDIVIDTASYNVLLSAARAFVKWYVEDRTALDAGDVYYGGAGSGLLMPKNTYTAALDSGVTYDGIYYEDARNQPVKAYLLTVENGAERIIMGTPDNGTAISGVKATVLDAINAAEADGLDIVGGINADFFHIESDYSPNGLCVKDGVILKQNTEVRPWIAVMKDGTMDCGIAGEARSKITEMKHGFGASHVILSKGKEYQTDAGSSFAEIRHPRTAMGYDSEGTVYLLVVDGRQPKLSNGASLLDLMLILKNCGAEYAVNLDGGGSSSMVFDGGEGFFTVNSPSDGSLRKIFNSVLITKE